MSDNESTDILKGNALEIYRLLLKAKKPLGIREIQRALKLSSPSIAQYHLSKLEYAGFVKKEAGNYVIDRITLDSCVKISRFLIPKYLFYCIFAAAALIIDLFYLNPPILTREYYFSIFVIGIFLIIFCYETIKVWIKGSL